jgi:hypothetical protein
LNEVRRYTRSERRTTPKNAPNAIPIMVFFLDCFVKIVGASAEPQLRSKIGPHNFGFPSMLLFENVYSTQRESAGGSMLLGLHL